MVNEIKVDGTYTEGAFREYMGEKIGDLTVVAYKGYRRIEKRRGKAKRIHFFTCNCKCGNTVYLTLHEVTDKKVKSCGNCKVGENVGSKNDNKALKSGNCKVEENVGSKNDNKALKSCNKALTECIKAKVENTTASAEMYTDKADEVTEEEKARRKELAENSVISDNMVVIRENYSEFKPYTRAKGIAGKALKNIAGKKCGHISIIDYAYTLENTFGGVSEYKIMFRGRCTCGRNCVVSYDEIMSGKDLICTVCADEYGITEMVNSNDNKTKGVEQTELTESAESTEQTEQTEQTELTEPTELTELTGNEILDKYAIPVYNIFSAYKDYTYDCLVGRRVANIAIEAFQRDVNSSTSYMLVKCDCGARFVISNKAMTYVKKQSESNSDIKFIRHSGCTINFPKKRSAYLKYLNESHSIPMIDTFAEIEDVKELLSMDTNIGSEDSKKEASNIEKSKTEETGDVSIMKIDNYIVRNNGNIDVDMTFNMCIWAVIAMSKAKMDNYSVEEYTVNNFEVKLRNNEAGLFAKQFADIVKGYDNMPQLRDDMLTLLIKYYLQEE